MSPPVEVVEILAKYKDQEETIDNLFEQIEKQHEIKVNVDHSQLRKFPIYEEARERNKKLLKDLETVKGNLRSKAIFSPTEMQWEEICKRYQDEPALAVATWRCNLPIFV